MLSSPACGTPCPAAHHPDPARDTGAPAEVSPGQQGEEQGSHGQGTRELGWEGSARHGLGSG